jgi:hypothetical protein
MIRISGGAKSLASPEHEADCGLAEEEFGNRSGFMNLRW